MIKGTEIINTVAALVAVASLGVAAGLAVFGRPDVPAPVRQVPYPVCQAEDGGPVPCVLDGPRYRQPSDTGPVVTVTERS